MDELKYQLGQRVRLTEIGEEGTVIARAEYMTGEPQYQLRYRATDGRLVECWWGESALRSH